MTSYFGASVLLCVVFSAAVLAAPTDGEEKIEGRISTRRYGGRQNPYYSNNYNNRPYHNPNAGHNAAVGGVLAGALAGAFGGNQGFGGRPHHGGGGFGIGNTGNSGFGSGGIGGSNGFGINNPYAPTQSPVISFQAVGPNNR